MIEQVVAVGAGKTCVGKDGDVRVMQRGWEHMHTRGIEERNADAFVGPHMGTSYSPESKQKQAEHYQVTLPCEMNAKMIVPIA
jgi:hypothetical protein